MIALVDYGAGNVRSVQKALIAAGGDARLVSDPERLMRADAVVLPGVGAFDDCINAMQRQELLESTRQFIASGKPFLGICVGYQALFEKSEEFNSSSSGMGIFQGKVVRFSGEEIKIPQIGWNTVNIQRPECPIFRGIDTGSHFYFVHSYFPEPRNSSIVASRTTYGVDFCSAIWDDNIFATQFHPEKSQKAGITLLNNFINIL